MKTVLFIAALFISSNVQASLRSVLEIGLKRNLQVEEARLSRLVSEKNSVIANAAYSLRLDFDGGYLDSNFERDPFSLVDANEAWDFNLSLTKPFTWGGELELASGHRHLHPKSSVPESFLFQQRLTYTQDLGKDFFGRSMQDEVRAYAIDEKIAELELSLQEREQTLSLSRLYIQGVSMRSLRALEEAALKRAQKRLRYVDQQVKDGLRERVDSLRSKENLLARETALRDNEEQTWRIREQLASLMAASATEVEFKSESMSYDWTKVWTGWHLKENTDRQLLIRRLDALALRAQAKDRQDFADVNLVASYGSNNWELERSDAFSKGRLGQDRDEWSVGIKVSMPWGNEEAKAEAQKVRAQKMMLERYQANWDEVLVHTARTFGERHKLLAKNLETAKERVKLASQALDAYNNLYSKGRANLEQVITAEEQLIADQKLVISSQQSLAELTLEAQAIAGRLEQFLLKDTNL